MKRFTEIISELSTDTLASYKKKAGEQASAADKAGDFAKGNKRFSGIIKATKKQFANDAKLAKSPFHMSKEEYDYLEERVKTTHEDPLVTVHDKDGLHTHANLSTANHIFSTDVKHTDVHKGPVKVKSGGSYGNVTFALSQHHAKEVQEELHLEESATSGLAAKAEKSGVSLSVLKKVYARGVAAWNSGHRPGTTPQQWGMARVNSYITKGKGTYHGADKDLREEEIVENNLPEVPKDKESGLPKKYVSGLSSATAKARAAHWDKMDKKSDSDPSSYELAPGDATAKTKESKHTKKYRELFGEEINEELYEACWDGYKQVGIKKKGEKMVPNCVPEETQIDEIHRMPTKFNSLDPLSSKALAKQKLMNLIKSGKAKGALIANQQRTLNAGDEIDQEDLESLHEVLGKDAGAGDWIKDFVHSDNPKFAGKSKKERIKMALGAYYNKARDKQQTEELVGGQKKLDKNKNGKLDSQDFKILRKESIDEEGNLMADKITFKEFMMMLEYEAKDGVYRHKGTYGGSYVDPEGADDADDKKPAQPPAVKRGRGRPAGSKSGARSTTGTSKLFK